MSMAYTAVAMAVVSAAIGGTTAYMSAENSKQLGNYNKTVAENNALDAAQRGAIEAAEHREKVRRMIATQNATYSAAGVDASTGSALQVQTDTAGFGELDALRILNNAQRGAAGSRAQGEIEQWKGDSAHTTGMFEAVGAGAAGVSSAYYGGKKGGLWGGDA